MTFYETITEAIRYFTEHGYEDEDKLRYWTDRIAKALAETATSNEAMMRLLNSNLNAVYRRLVDNAGVMRAHPGVPRFTLERVKQKLRAELDRRIMASANLIKLNRDQMIAQTLRRFSGWATSIPAGGSKIVDKAEVKSDIRKSLASMPFTERRCIIDQGHKLAAAINEVVATDAGAIALEWNSHWRQPGYDYRKDHKERDGEIYLLRDNWAQSKGLVKPGAAGYYDQVTAVGEEVCCRCYARYIYTLRKLPDNMLTSKGRETLKEARAA